MRVSARISFATANSGPDPGRRYPALLHREHSVMAVAQAPADDVSHRPVGGMTGRVSALRRWMFMQAGQPDHRPPTVGEPGTRGGPFYGHANTRYERCPGGNVLTSRAPTNNL